MDFEFSPEQLAFVEDVERFLDQHDDPEVFDVTRENMAQIVDTPARRAFMAAMGGRGWLGMTWPAEHGGTGGEGVYEYLLNEALARRGGPQIGKGVGIIGKTLIRHGSDKLKREFLPKILRNEVEFAVGYSEPNAGSDAA
jgi:alkylation response protein AidB-like acyl-CoA dehydrogenase